jgi:hypothetical protein
MRLPTRWARNLYIHTIEIVTATSIIYSTIYITIPGA